MPLRYIAIVLFARGFHVDEDRLKAAYAQVLDDIQAHGADEDGLGDGADHLAQQLRRRAKRIPIARRWVTRAGTYGARRNTPLEDGLVALTTALISAEQPDEQAGNVIMQIVGGPVGADDDVMERLALTTLPALREALRELTLGELVRARALLERSLNVVMRLQQLTLAVTGEPVADGLEDWELVNELGKAVSILSMAAVLQKLPGYEQALEQSEALVAATEAAAEPSRALESET